jgi:glucose/arabinose dehydrogenase
MAGLRGSGIFSLDIGDNEIKTKNILSGMGRIRDVIQGPDGYLYLITSNTDGKAFPDKDDDKLVRILK